MHRPPRVAIFVDMLSEYGRDILSGVSSYILAHEPWHIFGDPERVVAPISRMGNWAGDGIIAHVHTPEMVELIRGQGLPVVNVSEFMELPEVPAVLPENETIGRLAAEHLIERGFRDLAYCSFEGHVYARRRGEAFRQRAEAAGLGVEWYESRPPQEVADQWDRRQAELAEWVRSLPKPVGIFCCNDVRARHVAEAALITHLRVPEEIALLGVDNDELVCEMATPPLSSVDLSGEQVGYRAAMLLATLMKGEKALEIPIRVPPRGIVSRRSSDVLAIPDPDVAAAVAFIRDHGTEPIQIEDVVAATATSRRSLERRFRVQLNRTIGQEIALTRIDRAKQILVHTDLPIDEVARRCGFNYVQQFNTIFKRLTGTTPVRYRRQHRKA